MVMAGATTHGVLASPTSAAQTEAAVLGGVSGERTETRREGPDTKAADDDATPSLSDAGSTTSADEGQSEEGRDRTKGRPEGDYCSNELKAQATRKRILGEARNGARRVRREDQADPNNFYVTPPLNAYHRRLVHILAETKKLGHVSIELGEGGKRGVAAPLPLRRCEDCETAGGWCLLHAEELVEGKAVIIAPKHLLEREEEAGSVDDEAKKWTAQNQRLLERARWDAERKCPLATAPWGSAETRASRKFGRGPTSA